MLSIHACLFLAVLVLPQPKRLDGRIKTLSLLVTRAARWPCHVIQKKDKRQCIREGALVRGCRDKPLTGTSSCTKKKKEKETEKARIVTLYEEEGASNMSNIGERERNTVVLPLTFESS